MRPIQKALTNVEMLEDAEDVEDPAEQRVVALLNVAAALEEGTVLTTFGDARVRFESDDRTVFTDGELEIYPDWVRLVDDDQWIPRDRVLSVDPL